MATKTTTTGTAPKKARKTSTKTSTTTPPPRKNKPASEVQDEAPEITPFTPEAWAYLSQPSIAGVPHLPIYFLGGRVPMDIARAMGRPLDIEEAKLLVVPDGEVTKCGLTGEEFQPMKYVPFLSKKMEDGLKAGNRLDQIEIYYGGVYYVDNKRKVSAFSGPLFFYNKREGEYQYAKSSPLIVVTMEGRKKTGRMFWGVPLNIIDGQVAAREKNHEQHNKAAALVKNFINPRGQSRQSEFGSLPEEALNGLTRAGKLCRDRKPRHHRG